MKKEEYLKEFGEPLRTWCLSKWGDLKMAASVLDVSPSLLSRYINYTTEKKPGRKFCSQIVKWGFPESKIRWLDNVTVQDLDILDKDEIKWLYLELKEHVVRLEKTIEFYEKRVMEQSRLIGNVR